MLSHSSNIHDLEYFPVEGKKDIFFLKLNGNTYYVGHIILEILELLKKNKSYKEIAYRLNQNYDNDYFTEEIVQKTIEDNFFKTEVLTGQELSKEKQSHSNYIYGRIDFFNAENHQRTLKFLSLFFNPYLFFVLFTISISATIGFMFKTKDIIVDVKNYDLYIVGLLFALSILSTFWHELGHAAASYYYKIVPKDIGFGIYIVYPTFYTDVSDIWQLSSQKRIIVNVAGIYFQGISNILFIILYYLFPSLWFISSYIAFNTFAAVVSLNPFFRYDGYWIYSDFFNIPNLRGESQSFIVAFFKKLVGKEKLTWKQIFNKKKALIIYAFASNIFLTFMFISILWVTVAQFSHLNKLLNGHSYSLLTGKERFDLFRCILMILLSLGYVVWVLINFYKKRRYDK